MTPISLRDLQEDEDEAAIRSILSNEQYENSSLENLITRPLEPGDKADDAVDYEDFEFSDDNASEQGHSLAGSPRLKLPLADDSLFDIDDDIQGQGTDDLFGSDVEDQDDDVEDELEACYCRCCGDGGGHGVAVFMYMFKFYVCDRVAE